MQRAVIWAVALGVSVFFHAGVLILMPPLPVGAPPALSPPAHWPALHIREIRPLEDVGGGAAIAIRGKSTARPPGTMVPSKEVHAELLKGEPRSASFELRRRLQGERRALLKRAGRHDYGDADVLSEALKIEKERIREESAVLPRRIVAAVEKEESASPAAETPAKGDLLGEANGGGAEPEAVGMGPRSGPVAGTKLAAGGAASAGVKAAGVLEEIEGERERAGLVRGVEAAEKMMGIDVGAFRGADGYVYFRLDIRRTAPWNTPVLPKDVIFIQDSSDSMGNQMLEACRRGLSKWLKVLGKGDRFQLVVFSDEPYTLFPGLVKADAEHILKADDFMKSMRAHGRTDIFAILDMLGRPHSRRAAAGIFISDGRPTHGEVDAARIIGEFSRVNAGRVPIFCVGTGRKANHFLLEFLSYNNRGATLYAATPTGTERLMERLAGELSRPVLTGLSYNFVGTEVEAYPHLLTDLYLDRPLMLYGRMRSGVAAVLRIKGEGRHGSRDMVFSIRPDDSRTGDRRIAIEWARRKLYFLLSEYIRSGDQAYLSRAQRLGRKWALSMPYGTDTVPMW